MNNWYVKLSEFTSDCGVITQSMTPIEDMVSLKFNGAEYALGYDTCVTCNFTSVIDILSSH